MLCLLAGDSIALGLHSYLNCTVNARIGEHVPAIVNRISPAPFVIISAGSNDDCRPSLDVNLIKVRDAAGTSKVIWIAPADECRRLAVQAIAAKYGDAVVTFVPGKDKVHPNCNACLAVKIDAVMRYSKD